MSSMTGQTGLLLCCEEDFMKRSGRQKTSQLIINHI